MIYYLINILTLISAPLATFLLAHKKKEGFLVFIIVEFCYVYIGITTHQFGIVGVAVLYFFMNIYGYIQWNKSK